MLEYNERSITGMWYISLVNTALGRLVVEVAFSRSFVIGLSFDLWVGMASFSRLFALIMTRIVLQIWVCFDCHQFI